MENHSSQNQKQNSIAILTFLSFTIAKSKISEIQKGPKETKILLKTFKNTKSESEKLQNWKKKQDESIVCVTEIFC